MLNGINGTILTVKCDNCENENNFDVSEIKSSFSTEYNEYENVLFSCPICSSIEIFNMNIPIDDTDEPFETGDLPVDEEIQRAYVRLLMRIVREDFKK